MPIVVTHTDISRFLQCRRLWGWSYVQDWQPPPKLHGVLATGARVHKVIERFYDLSESTDKIIEYHDSLGQRDVDQLIAWGRPSYELDALYNDIIVGRNCVTAYLEWLAETGADAPFELAAVEHEVEAPLLDGEVILRGKVDQLFRSVDDGSLIVHDLKTSGSWWGNQRELLERSYQHHCYIIAEAYANPDVFISGAMYTVVKKVTNLERLYKLPVERFRVPATTRMAPFKRRQIEAICTEMLKVMGESDAIGSAVLYPSPQQACRWCDYSQPCELADENPLAARAMLDTNFVRGRRHARYVHGVESRPV